MWFQSGPCQPRMTHVSEDFCNCVFLQLCIFAVFSLDTFETAQVPFPTAGSSVVGSKEDFSLFRNK